MAFRTCGAVMLLLASGIGCADEAELFTAAQIEQLCVEWCSPELFSTGGVNMDACLRIQVSGLLQPTGGRTS